MDETPPPTSAPTGEVSVAEQVRVVLDAANGYDDAELDEILTRTDYESRRALVEAYRELYRVYRLQRTFRRQTM